MARPRTVNPPPPSGVIVPTYLRQQLEIQGANVPFKLHLFQEKVLLRPEFELFLGGGKYSGKSMCARFFLLKGNPDRASVDNHGNRIPVNDSYVYHPNYRATILRRNQSDLDDFIRKFKILAEPFGAEFTRGLFIFPSGAVIACGHLADKDAWQKYIGVENVRFVVEESTLIPEFNLFEQIRSCCRSIYPEMRAQIMLTANAGGPGMGWHLERYFEAKDSSDNIIPPWTTITESVPDPDSPNIQIHRTRIFCFSTYRDNPDAVRDTDYKATLATMKDDKLREAYLEGKWSAFSGVYFSTFRPRGPEPGEPPNARHVIPADPALLRPWWYRIGSIDVGHTHETAVYWAAQDPTTRQLHLYSELVVSGTSYVQIGFEIANRSLATLESLPSHSITFWISHDALHNRLGSDGKSIAELIAQGIARKLGPEAIHFPELEIKELRDMAIAKGLPPDAYEEDRIAKWSAQLKLQRRAGITLRIAPKERVIGWQYCRESLRFTSIGPPLQPFSPELANKLALESQERFITYVRTFESSDRLESLPMLQIWSPTPTTGEFLGCPRLIEAIPKARHAEPPQNPEDIDKAHFRGMDSLDSWRYLVMGLQQSTPEEPFESYRERAVTKFIAANPAATTADLIWQNRHLEAKWKEEKSGGQRNMSITRKARLGRLEGARQGREAKTIDISRLFSVGGGIPHP